MMDFEAIFRALEPIFGGFDAVFAGRMLLVLVLCGIIGLERSEHERASGFRPHILVGLGACLMTMAGAYALPDVSPRDPMRVASYVVSGIGFLGGGAILRHGTTVRGLTTAASIWGAAGIGIATGVGLGGLATLATLLILSTLTILERVETRFGLGESATDLRIHLSDSQRAVGKALTALERLGVQVRSATMMPAAGEASVLRVELNNPLKTEQVRSLIRQLMGLKSITRVEVTDLALEEEKAITQEMAVITQNIKRGYDHIDIDDADLLKDLNDQDEDPQTWDGPATETR